MKLVCDCDFEHKILQKYLYNSIEKIFEEIID